MQESEVGCVVEFYQTGFQGEYIGWVMVVYAHRERYTQESTCSVIGTNDTHSRGFCSSLSIMYNLFYPTKSIYVIQLQQGVLNNARLLGDRGMLLESWRLRRELKKGAEIVACGRETMGSD